MDIFPFGFSLLYIGFMDHPMNCTLQTKYHWTLINNHSEAKVWKGKRAWSWHGRSRSTCCTLAWATVKRSWRFQEATLLGTNGALFLTQTLSHSGVVDTLIDKTKNIKLLVGIVELLDDTMKSSRKSHHKVFYVPALTFCW